MTMGTGRGEGGGEVASSMRLSSSMRVDRPGGERDGYSRVAEEGKGKRIVRKNLSDVPFLFSKRIREPIEFLPLPLRAEMSWKHLGDDN